MTPIPSCDEPAGPVRILHLEDSALDADLIREFLRADKLPFSIDRVWTRDAFAGALQARAYDLILADHELPNFDGGAALAIARTRAPETPFIFVSGTLGEDVAVESLKRGATDYVVKQRLERLPGVVRRALDEARRHGELQRAEAALRASEENFSTLVNAMPQLCWMTDPAGIATWYNHRWHDYIGATPRGMPGCGWAEIHDPACFPDVRERWNDAIAQGAPFEMIFPLKGRDGTFRSFLTLVLPVRDDAGNVTRWLGTNTDISAQLEAEEALRRLNETLEQRVVAAIAEREAILAKLNETQRLETIGQLTGGFAHDFNNLLTPIVASLELLNAGTISGERAHRLLRSAMLAADRARTLVQRLLAFARRQVLDPRAVHIASLVQGLNELIHHSIGSGIDLAVDVPDDLPAARVDPHQLELALLNLVVNARDAMPGGAFCASPPMRSTWAPATPAACGTASTCAWR